MQPRVTQAGPLIAASATNIALSQTVPAAQGVVLNGASGVFVANNIATSQTLSGAASVTFATAYAVNSLFGYTAQLPTSTLFGGLWFPQVYITSAGNDSGVTFTILGRDELGNVRTETITGSNTSVAGSKYRYSCLYSIKSSGATASTITVGTFLPVTLDAQRQILFTDGGVDTGITFSISGLDASGNPISEVVTGSSGATVASVLSYYVVTKIFASGATASTLTVGTNGTASSPWIRLDDWATGAVAFQAVVSGTVNFTVQTSDDDPNSYGNPITASAVTWDSNQANVSAATASVASGLAVAPSWMRVLLNSQTNPGYVRLTIVQASAVPY
jgi:hypothetical protein